MMRQALFVAAAALAAAPSSAAADCIATCGDICYAPAETGFYRAEVVEVEDGYARRVRIVEHLSGEPTNELDTERDDVYVDQQVTAGTSIFVAIAAPADGTSGNYVWNVGRVIDNGEVVCSVEDRRIEVNQFAAMAASSDCEGIRAQLSLESPPCNDTFDGGCNAGGSLGLGTFGALALVLRRRRRA